MSTALRIPPLASHLHRVPLLPPRAGVAAASIAVTLAVAAAVRQRVAPVRGTGQHPERATLYRYGVQVNATLRRDRRERSAEASTTSADKSSRGPGAGP